MKSLGCLFAILIIIFIAVFVLLRTVTKIISAFFGLGRTSGGGASNRQRRAPNDFSQKESTTDTQQKNARSSGKANGNKVIGDDEGEYIDFEEVK